MTTSLKQKAIGLAAAQVLKFNDEYKGTWYDGYLLLLECMQQDREPEHCAIRDDVEFWSWHEVVQFIDKEAENIWKPMENELADTKQLIVHDAASRLDKFCGIDVERFGELDKACQTIVLNKAVVLAVDKVNRDEPESEQTKFHVRSYSGRFMYGRTCLGIDVPPGKDLSAVASCMGNLFKFLGTPRQDQMGKGTIYYWPNIEQCESHDVAL
ncbi:TPA: hypothetical protein ACX3EG_003712 [Vibrio parahaemolyticus]|uniref:hypothetical protein n=1 Tax=Vibrio vulnificus TaxID=672 RepID=UPI0032427F2D